MKKPDWVAPKHLHLLKRRDILGQAAFEREYMNQPVVDRCDKCNSVLTNEPLNGMPFPDNKPPLLLYCHTCGLVKTDRNR